jgi:hypothetical protein
MLVYEFILILSIIDKLNSNAVKIILAFCYEVFIFQIKTKYY